MSRSYKRPYYTDQARSNISKQKKRLANKTVRRSKHIWNGKSYRRVYETYDIRDYSFYCPDDPKAYRK